MQQEAENLELFIKVAADSIGELRKVDVMRVLESNSMRKRPLANYIRQHRPDLAKEVAEVMEDEFGIADWRTNGAAEHAWSGSSQRHELPASEANFFASL